MNACGRHTKCAKVHLVIFVLFIRTYLRLPLHKTEPGKAVSIKRLFVAVWLLLFVLYLPAAKAGFVSDFTGWLDSIKNSSFGDYINRTGFKVVSLYQFTQFVTWTYYQIAGANVWMWHLLFITMHAINASLVFKLCAGMLRDAEVENYELPSYVGVALFCVTPYVSEVIVWEPSFHYLLGMMLLLVIMILAKRFMFEPRLRYALAACAIYALSTHSLEVFYITPWFVLLLGVFYKYLAPQGKDTFGGIIVLFVIPMLFLFLLRLLEYRLLYGDWVSRIGSQTVLEGAGWGKPAKYVFHLLFLGRYIPAEWHIGNVTFGAVREHVYEWCDSTMGIVVFYTFCVLGFAWGAFRYKYMSGKAQVALILAAWAMIGLLLIMPLWFGDLLLVVYDRYTYFAAPFFFTFVAVCLMYIRSKSIRVLIVALLLFGNLRFSIQAVRYWWKAEKIITSLLQGLPAQDDKITVLLNVPDSMHGVLMIGSSGESEYKLMRNLLVPEKTMKGKVYDGMSYNMAAPEDGAHVQVVNDSTISVHLNQYGTWWWYNGLGGHDHENEDIAARITNDGYELVMKKPAGEYALYFQVGSEWKRVDMSQTHEQY